MPAFCLPLLLSKQTHVGISYWFLGCVYLAKFPTQKHRQGTGDDEEPSSKSATQALGKRSHCNTIRYGALTIGLRYDCPKPLRWLLVSILPDDDVRKTDFAIAPARVSRVSRVSRVRQHFLQCAEVKSSQVRVDRDLICTYSNRSFNHQL